MKCVKMSNCVPKSIVSKIKIKTQNICQKWCLQSRIIIKSIGIEVDLLGRKSQQISWSGFKRGWSPLLVNR